MPRLTATATAACSVLALVLLGACGQRQHAGEAPLPGPGSSPGQPTATIGTTLAVGRTEPHGVHLADAMGRPLYALEEDPDGTSVCYDACAQAWPPLLATEAGAGVAAESGLDPARLSTLRRHDGSLQVAYAGRPLYYYAADRGPDIAHGHEVKDAWGYWYLLGPDGEALDSPGGAQTQAAERGAPAQPR